MQEKWAKGGWMLWKRGWVREEAFAQLMEGKIIAFKGEKWAPRKVRYVSPFNRRWWEKWINICTEWVIALGWFYLWGHTHNTHNGVFKKNGPWFDPEDKPEVIPKHNQETAITLLYTCWICAHLNLVYSPLVTSLQYFSGQVLKNLRRHQQELLCRKRGCIKCSDTSVFDGFPLAGAYVGRKCSACPETAGAAAQRRWPPTQRNCGLAQHAQLDLQTPPPLLSQKGLLKEEPAQTGRTGKHNWSVSLF